MTHRVPVTTTTEDSQTGNVDFDACYVPGGGGGGPHAADHANGGADELSVQGLSGVLADPQTPAAHAHVQADVTGLVTALAGKASTTHAHGIDDVTGLQTALDGKMTSEATLTALAGLTNSAGVVEQTSPDAFTIRAIGVAASTSLPTRADADARYAAAGAIATHEAASDPHTGYQRESEKAQAFGYAGIGSNGIVPTAQLGNGVADATTFLCGDQTYKVPSGGSSSPQISRVILQPGFATANLTATKSLTSNSAFAVYMGRAPAALTSVQARYRVTTAAVTITWAEVALAKGAPVVGGNPTLTVVGFTNVAAVVNSTGQKTTTISVSGGQSVAAGDDVWLIIGNQSTTAAIVRAQSIADDLQTGTQASRAATRPSLAVGGGQVYTIEGATTLAPWIAMVL